MKSISIYIMMVLGIVFFINCSRMTRPSIGYSPGKKDYDSVAFDYLYAEAIKQKVMGNAPDALKFLEQCIEINPRSDAAYHQLALVTLQIGDIKNAKINALRASSIQDKNIWYLTLLAGIYYQEGNIDSALIFYERAVRLFPERNEIKITLGNIYSEKGEYEKANEIFSYFEDKYGINEKTTLMHVRNLMNSGDFSGAEERILVLMKDAPEEITYNGILAEIYRKKGDNNKAMDVYQKLLELDSTNPQTLLSFCDFMIAEKQFDNLFTLLNAVAVNERITTEGKIALIAKIIDNEDIIKEKGRELDIVLRIFEEAEKNNDIIVLLRPELYQKAGESEKAIEILEEIIGNKPENYFAWEKLLLLYSELKKYDLLLAKGKECATRFNMSYLAKVLYANAAIEKELYDVALEELRKARILAGSQPELLAQVLTMEADIYYRKGNYEKSFQIFEEALKGNPEDLIVLNNYAYYLAEQEKDLKNAEKMIRYVMERENDNNTFKDTYAWVLYKMGRVRDAIKVMDSIMLDDPTPDYEWYEHYGFMMKAVKKCDIAIQYWNKAMELSPGTTKLMDEIKNCRK